MRPPVLDPLFAPVSALDGIGPRIAVLLRNLIPVPESVDEPRILGLVFHLPHSIIDRRNRPGIAHSPEGAIAVHRDGELLAQGCGAGGKCQGAGCGFFNDTATTEIYTLSLHDALPIARTR